MNIACIFAGGIGKRFSNDKMPKQFHDLCGKPIIIRTIETFAYHNSIDKIIVACKKEWIEYLENLLVEYKVPKVSKIVEGGSTSQLSIYNILLEAEKVSEENDIVLIHDGVRLFVDEETISKNISEMEKYNSCITSVDVQETIFASLDDLYVKNILERSKIRMARAPQTFFLKDILAVHKKAIKEKMVNFTDSCSIMQYYGRELHYINGNKENIKITSKQDFYFAEAILKMKKTETQDNEE